MELRELGKLRAVRGGDGREELPKAGGEGRRKKGVERDDIRV